MKLSIRYFGIVREKLGVGGEDLELAAGTDVAALMRSLAGRHAIFDLGAGTLRTAVNLEYVGAEHELHDGDEIAIIPPVSGGAPEE